MTISDNDFGKKQGSRENAQLKQAGSNAALNASVGAVDGQVSPVLEFLNQAFQQHWNLGQNILLCWYSSPKGVELLLAPHHFLGQFTASLNNCDPIDRLDALNGRYIREMISGPRHLSVEDFKGAASRLQLTPVVIELPSTLRITPDVYSDVDALIKRYSINFVKSRAVLLFDIVNFSLASPFEQTSQLNSLSYSLNAVLSKMRERNIDIDVLRTTTGDGYYVWHDIESPKANLELFEFMVMVIADNELARRTAQQSSSGQVVPIIRSAFHIGSHFEFYQLELLHPGMNKFIVGEVTIELARMLDLAEPGQIFIGDFETRIPTSNRDGAYIITVDSQHFVARGTKRIARLKEVALPSETVKSLHCFLSGETGASGGQTVRRFRITDKHGQTRNVYNLRMIVKAGVNGKPIILGQQDSRLPKRDYSRQGDRRAPNSPRRLRAMLSKNKAFISAYED